MASRIRSTVARSQCFRSFLTDALKLILAGIPGPEFNGTQYRIILVMQPVQGKLIVSILGKVLGQGRLYDEALRPTQPLAYFCKSGIQFVIQTYRDRRSHMLPLYYIVADILHRNTDIVKVFTGCPTIP